MINVWNVLLLLVLCVMMFKVFQEDILDILYRIKRSASQSFSMANKLSNYDMMSAELKKCTNNILYAVRDIDKIKEDVDGIATTLQDIEHDNSSHDEAISNMNDEVNSVIDDVATLNKLILNNTALNDGHKINIAHIKHTVEVNEINMNDVEKKLEELTQNMTNILTMFMKKCDDVEIKAVVNKLVKQPER